MEVFINNQSVTVFQSATLAEVLQQYHVLDKKGIAVAVNYTVVPKAQWSSYTIAYADKITIIRATQGG